VTAIFRRRSVCCRRCGLAGYCGRAYFDWGRFRLGTDGYKAVQFLLCLRCGVGHAFGSQDIRLTDPGPLFAQPAPLRLDREKRSSGGLLWGGEWDDCVSEEGAYARCPDQPSGPPEWRELGEGVEVAGGLPCARCGRAGELADLLIREGRPVRCPGCGQVSLESLHS
jgi:hypothetical protein